MMLIETQLDFYQFRWLTVLSVNQLLIIGSTAANPLTTLVITAVITYPYMNMLQISDLKRIDPMAILVQKQDQDDVLPSGGLIQKQVKRERIIIRAAFEWVISIVLLIYLMSYREELTPDFFHFIVNLNQDYCHKIWVIGVWSIFKCFLNEKDTNQPLQQRALFFMVQGTLGLLLSTQIDYVSLFVLISIISLSYLRELFPKEVNWIVTFFLILYSIQNFIVNLIDIIVFRTLLNKGGYYHDEEFQNSFSYRVFQAFICVIFAVLYTQILKPGYEKILLIPQILEQIFQLTIPASFCMFFLFLYELTFEPPAKRTRIYKQELTKVFFSIIYFYLVSMIFANWIQSLRKFINLQHKRLEQHNAQKSAKAFEIDPIVAKMRQEKEEIKKGKKLATKKFTLQNFTLTDFIDLGLNQFDQFLIDQCLHFRDVEFMNVMRSIQNTSALIFFILIHVPLARVSSFFSLLTTLIPLILDKRNKEKIYLVAFKLAAYVSFDKQVQAPEILRKKSDIAQKFKTRKYEEFRENQKAAINITVFYIGLFVALLFNYTYICYLGQFVNFACEMIIRLFDSLGFEVHFVRLIYFTIFDQTKSDLTAEQRSEMIYSLLIDHAHLILIIIPLFILSIKYLTASSVEHYNRKANALLAPLAVIPMFFFYHYDILTLAFLVLFSNLWVAWKQLDTDEYSWASFYREQYERTGWAYGSSKLHNNYNQNQNFNYNPVNELTAVDPMTFPIGSGIYR